MKLNDIFETIERKVKSISYKQLGDKSWVAKVHMEGKDYPVVHINKDLQKLKKVIKDKFGKSN